ncbi:MAG: hypothetical protein ACYCW6_25810, partial [Candidatus Xenobia bacterium]
DGFVLDKLHAAVQSAIEKQVGATFGEVAKTIPQAAHDSVQQQWSATEAQIQQTIDQVMHLPVTVRPTIQPVPMPAPPAAAPAATGPELPARPWQQLYHAVQQMPAFQTELQKRIAAARSEAQQQLAHLPAMTRQDLMDAQVTLPADLGGKTITVPLVLSEQAQPSPLKVNVDVAPVTLKQPPKAPGMVYLGSYQTIVTAQSSMLDVTGTARVGIDDGRTTAAALKSWQARAQGVDADSPQGKAIAGNIARLRERLAAGHDLPDIGQPGVHVAMQVPLPHDRPLLVGTTHIWAAPGGPQGLPRIVLTDDLQTPGIDGLKASHVKLEALPHAPGALQDMISKAVLQQAQGLVADATRTLPDQARAQAQQSWQQAIGRMQASTNQSIQDLLTENLPLHFSHAALPPAAEQPAFAAPARAEVPAGSMLMVISPDTMGQLMTQMQSSPEVQAQLRATVAQAQERLTHPAPIEAHDRMAVDGMHVDVHERMQPDAIPGRVDVVPRVLTGRERPTGPPGAIYLASFESSVWATQPSMQAHGQVDISMPDLPPDAKAALGALAQQQVQVHTTLALPMDRPLLHGMHHLWLTANGIQITDQVATPGARETRLENTRLQVVSHPAPPGLESLQKVIAARLQAQGQSAVQQLGSEIPQRVAAAAHACWDQALPQAQQTAEKTLQGFYAKHQGMQVPVGGGGLLAGHVTANLTRLVPLPNGDVGVVVRAPGQLEHLPAAGVNPTTGIDTVVAGDSVNALLRDRSEGGNVDWSAFLQKMAQQKGMRSLQFNRDANGHLLTPHLVVRNGQLYSEFDLTADVSGLSPVGTVTGALNRATGLVKHVPVLSLLHTVTDGLKTVLDHTVGVVVDTLPERATRPVISVHVAIPLLLDVHDGVMSVTPQAGGVQITDGHGSNGQLVLPTQLPGSALGQAIAKGQGASLMGSDLGRMGMHLDLRKEGIRFANVQVRNGPDLQVHVELSPGFSMQQLEGLTR